MNKPRLESKVYIISYSGFIVGMYVYALGKNVFFASESKNYYNDPFVGTENPISYDSFNDNWFKKLRLAKQELLKRFPDSKIVKYRSEDYWEARSET